MNRRRNLMIKLGTGALVASSGLSPWRPYAWSQPQTTHNEDVTVVANTKFRVGDSYTHRVIDHFTNIEHLRVRTVTEVTIREVIYNDGYVTDALGNPLRTDEGRLITGCQLWSLSYAVGKHWATHYKEVGHKGVSNDVDKEVRVVEREYITVPAGTFNAFVLDVEGWTVGNMPGYQVHNLNKDRFWIAPDQVRAPIVSELKEFVHRGTLKSWKREELTAYRQT